MFIGQLQHIGTKIVINVQVLFALEDFLKSWLALTIIDLDYSIYHFNKNLFLGILYQFVIVLFYFSRGINTIYNVVMQVILMWNSDYSCD